jgi:hypothetical protein
MTIYATQLRPKATPNVTVGPILPADFTVQTTVFTHGTAIPLFAAPDVTRFVQPHPDLKKRVTVPVTSGPSTNGVYHFTEAAWQALSKPSKTFLVSSFDEYWPNSRDSGLYPPGTPNVLVLAPFRGHFREWNDMRPVYPSLEWYDPFGTTILRNVGTMFVLQAGSTIAITSNAGMFQVDGDFLSAMYEVLP